MKNFKKTIIMFLFIIVSTGCEANYNLKIINNEFDEEIVGLSYDKATWSKEDEFGDSLLSEFQANFNINDPAFYDAQIPSESNDKVEGIEYYEKDFLEESDQLKLTVKHKFSLADFPNSLSMKSLFPNFIIDDRAGVVALDTGKVFYGFYYYPNLDSIKVTITTNHVVVDHNATEVKDNNYIWYLTRETVDTDDNMLNTIRFHYSKSKTNDPKTFSMTLIFIIIGVAILTIIAIIIARGHIKANNG